MAEDFLRGRGAGHARPARVVSAVPGRRHGLAVVRAGLLCNGGERVVRGDVGVEVVLHVAHAEQEASLGATNADHSDLRADSRKRHLERRRHGLNLQEVPSPVQQRGEGLAVRAYQELRQVPPAHRCAKEGILHLPRLHDARSGIHPEQDLARKPRHLLQTLRHQVALLGLLLRAPLQPRLRLVPPAAAPEEQAAKAHVKA